MKTEDKIFNKHMTLRTGNIDYMSRSAFHRAMKEYATQSDKSQGEEEIKDGCHEGILISVNGADAFPTLIYRQEEWVSVVDRLPEESGFYWITLGETNVRKEFYTKDVNVWGVELDYHPDPAYWKPYKEVIPYPPKATEEVESKGSFLNKSNSKTIGTSHFDSDEMKFSYSKEVPTISEGLRNVISDAMDNLAAAVNSKGDVDVADHVTGLTKAINSLSRIEHKSHHHAGKNTSQVVDTEQVEHKESEPGVSDEEIKKAASDYEKIACCEKDHPFLKDYVNEDFEAGAKWAIATLQQQQAQDYYDKAMDYLNEEGKPPKGFSDFQISTAVFIASGLNTK